MKDIAEALGISIVSVSKALSGKDGVSEKRKNEIIRKAEELGYYKTSTKARTEKFIGVIVLDQFFSVNAFYYNLLKSVMIYASSYKYTGLMEVLTPKMEENLIAPSFLRENKVQGYIILGQVEKRYLKVIENYHIPHVLLDFFLPDENIDSVVVNSLDGVYKLTKDLIKQGYRDIAFVGSVNKFEFVMLRYLGFLKAVKEVKDLIPLEYRLIDREGRENLLPINLDITLPDVFVCSCDETAYGLMSQLNKAGIKIPHDVGVTGFDDSSYAALCKPPLTTVRVDVDKMGAIAIETLIENMNNEKRLARMISVPTNIVIRESAKKQKSS